MSNRLRWPVRLETALQSNPGRHIVLEFDKHNNLFVVAFDGKVVCHPQLHFAVNKLLKDPK